MPHIININKHTRSSCTQSDPFEVRCLGLLVFGGLCEVVRLTIPNSMTIRAAVVARQALDFTNNLLLRALLGNVANLVTVCTFRLSSIGDITCVVQTGQNLIDTFRPALDLSGPLGLIRKPVRDRVLFTHVALQIHVGENLDQRPLRGNKPNIDLVVDKCFLELAESDSAIQCLHVCLNAFLRIVSILLSRCTLDHVPSKLSSHVGDAAAVDLPSIGTILTQVPYVC